MQHSPCWESPGTGDSIKANSLECERQATTPCNHIGRSRARSLLALPQQGHTMGSLFSKDKEKDAKGKSGPQKPGSAPAKLEGLDGTTPPVQPTKRAVTPEATSRPHKTEEVACCADACVPLRPVT